jgi:Beta-galactosidase/beta-glucuronidase
MKLLLSAMALAGLALAALAPRCAAADPQEAATARSGPVPVRVVREGARWTLLRGGAPYYVKGAGGSDRLEVLKQSGGNSIRGWGAENAGRDLDAAQAQGLTMTVGIWLGHKQHGFKYDDPEMVRRQLETAREVARKHKDHPALLLWGVGNEMEGDGKDDNVWKAVEEVARAIKQIDPNHPTMTVVAEIGEGGIKAKKVAELCPSVDILGVNSYGGLASLPKRLKEAGWTKPYIVTEFGPNGPWEVGKSSWGAALEPNSTEKGAIYLRNYESGIGSQKGWCLGSYAFLWGEKFEATATWFGMFLPGGMERLAPVDAMHYAWNGKWPATRVPELVTFESSVGKKEITPGSQQQVTCAAKSDLPLTYHFEIRPDTEGPSSFEPGQKPKDVVEGLFPPPGPNGVQTFRAPEKPGAYRLFVYVRDTRGGAATANVPFLVQDATIATDPAVRRATLPVMLSGEGTSAGTPAFVPTGWMGNQENIRLEEQWRDRPHSGETCVKVSYVGKDGWAGVVWQHPANDWGERPEGWNLTGAKKLTFWARGETGEETVDFSFGLLGTDKKYYDTASGKLPGVRLTKEWKQYEVDLTGKNLSRIKSGFAWVVAAQGKPITFYLDDIRFE